MSHAFLTSLSRIGWKIMKILYLITKSEPMGGVQKYVYDLTQALLSENIDVSVALGGNGTLKELLEKKGVHTHIIKSFQRNVHVFKELTALFEIMRLYKKVSPDIVHLNSSKAGGLGAFAACCLNIGRARRNQKKIQTIFTAHGWAFTENRPKWQQLTLSLLQIITVLLSDITITVSDHTKQEILFQTPTFLHRFMQKKIVSIPNGVEPFELRNVREARKELIERTRLRGSVDLWSTQTLWIGSIAELHKNKGIDIAIEAIACIAPEFSKNKVSLVYFVIGDGEERARLEQLIHRRKLDSIIFLVGYVPGARSYLSALDIYLLPSRKEGLPWVLLEAGYAQLPVIATGVGGITDVINHEQNGIITHIDHHQMGDAILKLAKDTPKRISFGKKLKKQIENEFNGEEMLKRTIRLYWMLE